MRKRPCVVEDMLPVALATPDTKGICGDPNCVKEHGLELDSCSCGAEGVKCQTFMSEGPPFVQLLCIRCGVLRAAFYLATDDDIKRRA